ncbi:hypothetical protein [Aquirufa aurantiipilula]
MEKEIIVEAVIEVVVFQSFTVPKDYKVKNTNPYEAYEELIERFGDIDENLNDDPYNVEVKQLIDGAKYLGALGDFVEIDKENGDYKFVKFKKRKMR